MSSTTQDELKAQIHQRVKTAMIYAAEPKTTYIRAMLEDTTNVLAKAFDTALQLAVVSARIDEIQKAIDTHLWNDGMHIYLKEGQQQLLKQKAELEGEL